MRLNHAIDSIGAKRVVLDTVGCALGGYSSEPAAIARAIADEHSKTISPQSCVFIGSLFYTRVIFFERPGGRDNVAQQGVSRFPAQRSLQFAGIGH